MVGEMGYACLPKTVKGVAEPTVVVLILESL